MSPTLVALAGAVAGAIARELLLWYDSALRRRGERRTRNGDH